MTQASALAMVASKSLARRRLRPSQAKVRSATQRRGSGLKVPMLWGLVTISIVHLPRSATHRVALVHEAIGEDMNGVHHGAQFGRPRKTYASRLRHQRFQQHPLRVRRVACKTQPVAPILAASYFSPRHSALHRISQIRRNYIQLKSLTSFSAKLSGGSGLKLVDGGGLKQLCHSSWRVLQFF